MRETALQLIRPYVDSQYTIEEIKEAEPTVSLLNMGSAYLLNDSVIVSQDGKAESFPLGELYEEIKKELEAYEQ